MNYMLDDAAEEDEISLPADATSLQFMQAVYRDSRQPTADDQKDESSGGGLALRTSQARR